MPSGASPVLDERTLESSNANLLAVLKEGQRVLDVGCGSGAITSGIAEKVGSGGWVLGVDRSTELIDLAKSKFGSVKNLAFEAADILHYADVLHHERALPFDVITTARTLQWIADPTPVIAKMIGLLKPGGRLCVLDYNHNRIEWQPLPPQSMLFFYEQFLRWRQDVGMDNEIGDGIGKLLSDQGMTIETITDQSEYCQQGSPCFQAQIAIWTKVAQTRGYQLVSDGYLTEEQRQKAAYEYTEWCHTDAVSMKLTLKATHATRSPDPV